VATMRRALGPTDSFNALPSQVYHQLLLEGLLSRHVIQQAITICFCVPLCPRPLSPGGGVVPSGCPEAFPRRKLRLPRRKQTLGTFLRVLSARNCQIGYHTSLGSAEIAIWPNPEESLCLRLIWMYACIYVCTDVHLYVYIYVVHMCMCMLIGARHARELSISTISTYSYSRVMPPGLLWSNTKLMVCVSIYISVFMTICISFYISICISIYISIHISIHITI